MKKTFILLFCLIGFGTQRFSSQTDSISIENMAQLAGDIP